MTIVEQRDDLIREAKSRPLGKQRGSLADAAAMLTRVLALADAAQRLRRMFPDPPTGCHVITAGELTTMNKAVSDMETAGDI